MHLFYTLIASGMLVLTEIPVEQPPPPIPIYAAVAAVSTEGWQTALGRFETSFIDSVSSIGTDGVWMVDATTVSYRESYQEPYQSSTALIFPIEYVQASFEVGQPTQIQAERLQDGTELIPSEPKASPTPTPTIMATPMAASSLPRAKDESWQVTYHQSSALPITGLAMFYNPNVMQEVVSNRLKMGQISACPECIGNVALLRAGDLNRRVWLQWGDGAVEGPFLVADVAAIQHVPQLLARNWAVDVDDSTAVRRKMNGPVAVTVWGARPSSSQQSAPPFAPLYPTETVVGATPIPSPVIQSTPQATPGAAPSAPVMAVQAGFPTETPVPTMTALPVLNATPTSPAVATPTPLPTALVVPSPTATPTQIPTLTPIPTGVPSAGENSTVVATSMVTQGGFPKDTPTPTITPLPALSTTATATVAVSVLVTVPPTGTPVPTVEPTFTTIPAATPSPTPMATITPTPSSTLSPTMSPTPTVTTTDLPLPEQRGFPTETPVPTITPLPALSPYPTPTAAN